MDYIDIGDGEPILLIHGLGQCKESWNPQLPLSNQYRLIIPDLRGHGETELEEDITMYNFAADLVELLKYLRIDEIFVCGLSLGGIIAQELYRHCPWMIKGFILANTTSYIIPFFSEHIVNQAIRDYQKPHFVDMVAKRALYNPKHQTKAKEGFWIRERYLDAVQAPVGKNYFPLLSRIQKPVLLMGSTHDMVTPIVNMWAMKFCIWQADIQIFWEAGHLSNLENPELFNKAVDNFVRREVR